MSTLQSNPSPVRRAVAVFVGLSIYVIVPLFSRQAQAADWMFRPSFYTHTMTPEMEALYPPRQSRSAYRPAYVGAGPGFAIRGGYRYNTMVINSGSSRDVTIFRQDWFEISP